MKGTDKFLIAIVGGIVLLVVVVIAVVLLRPEPEYMDGDTPEAVVHNYLLALENGEYERALDNISSSLKYAPKDENAFVEAMDDCSWNFNDRDRDTTLVVTSSNIRADKASVEVKQTVFYSGDMFDSDTYEYEFDMTLERQNGTWKLIDSDKYWCYCWSDEDGCK